MTKPVLGVAGVMVLFVLLFPPKQVFFEDMGDDRVTVHATPIIQRHPVWSDAHFIHREQWIGEIVGVVFLGLVAVAIAAMVSRGLESRREARWRATESLRKEGPDLMRRRADQGPPNRP